MITILQGKDMAAMDSNGKLGMGLPFSTDKGCNIRLAFVNQLRIFCNGDDLTLRSCSIRFLTLVSVARIHQGKHCL